jgi:hypothetical protein
MAPPRLKRGVFGYTKASVEGVLADRDRLLARAPEQARAAAARIRELEGALRETQARAADLAERAETAERGATRSRTEADAMRDAAERSTDAVARAARMELQARTAQAELSELHEQLHVSQARQAELERQLASVGTGGPGETAPDRLVVSVSETPATTQDLANARAAADQAVARIVQAARAHGEEELRRLEHVRGSTRIALARWSAWQERASRAVADLRWSLTEAMRRTGALGEHLAEPARAADRALDELDRRLTRLREVAGDIPSDDVGIEGVDEETRLIAIPEPETGSGKGSAPSGR